MEVDTEGVDERRPEKQVRDTSNWLIPSIIQLYFDYVRFLPLRVSDPPRALFICL